MGLCVKEMNARHEPYSLSQFISLTMEGRTLPVYMMFPTEQEARCLSKYETNK